MADLTFTIEFNSNGEAVVKNLAGSIDQLSNKTRAIESTGKAFEKFDASLRPANQALNILTAQLGLLGPVGNAAGNILLDLASGLGRSAAAVSLFAVGVTAAGMALRQTSDEAQAFGAAVASGQREFFAAGLERLRSIAADRQGALSGMLSAVRGIFGDTDRLVFDLTGKIRDYQAQLDRIDATRAREVAEAFRLQAQAIGASPAERIRIDAEQQMRQLHQALREGKIGWQEYRAAVAGIGEMRAASLDEFNRSLREQIDLLRTAGDPLAQIEIRMRALRQGADTRTLGHLAELQRLREDAARREMQNEIVALQMQRAAIGATARDLRSLDLAQQLNQLETRRLAGAHGEFIDVLTAEAVAIARSRNALAEAQSGLQARVDFQNQFGVVFDIDRKIIGDKLVSSFAAVFERLKSDRSAEQQLQQAFSSLVFQALEAGVPDVGELIASKIGGANFQRLRAGLGEELRAALDQSAQAGQQWGEVFDAEFRALIVDAQALGRAVENYDQRIQRSINSVLGLRQAIDAIPDVTIKQVIVETFYAASPARPFSQFLPFMTETFARFEQIVSSATPDILLRVQGLPAMARALADLEASEREIMLTPTHAPGTPFYAYANNPMTSGRVFLSDSERRRQLTAVRSQIEDVRFNIAAAIRQASDQGSAAAGSGSVNVTIDLRESSLSRDFLDDELVPALERAILRATGRSPGLRVVN